MNKTIKKTWKEIDRYVTNKTFVFKKYIKIKINEKYLKRNFFESRLWKAE